MIIRWISIALMGCIGFHVSGQTPVDGTFTVPQKLWNSSYLPKNRDQMVNGEGYRLYPGPLPKVLYSMGLDTQGPAVDWELQVNLDRNAPSWHGVCNGWAASAILYGEPGPIVVNGVKILPGDHKSFLSSIFKDNTIQRYGAIDPVLGGLSPDSFEELLFRFVVTEKQPVVFDVALDDEVWNYPIKGFTRTSEVQGDWTYVKIVTLFPSLTPILDSVDEFFSQEFTYDFRYRTASKSDYQWLGDSVEDHPQIAWLPRFPYLKGVDVVNANHNYQLATYEKILELAQREGHKDDFFEPNNSSDQAAEISNELVLGSLLLEDIDFYNLNLAAGEPLSFEAKVYDGQAINFSVFDPNGNEVASASNSKELSVNFVAGFSGQYQIKITQNEDAFVDSYYQLVFPEDASSFRSGPFGKNPSTTGSVVGINTTNKNAVFAMMDSKVVPAYGSVGFVDIPEAVELRSSERTLWAESFKGIQGEYKQYHLDHQHKTNYLVPHVTCRNGWKTFLEIRRQANKPVWLRVYGQDGAQLTRIALDFDDSGVFQKGMENLLPDETLQSAAWIDFETEAPLKGFVSFAGPISGNLKFDIASRPRFGEMTVFDLKNSGQGGTGLALVSTSKNENELIYWIEDGRGNKLVRDTFFLQEGQKWLTLIDSLLDEPMQDDYVFYMHSQFPVEAIVVQAGVDFVYGHRILGMDLDRKNETYVSVPENREDAGYIFANFGDVSRHVLFEGFSEDGQLQGRFNIKLGRPLQVKEVTRVPLLQIFDNGVDVKDLNAISHLRITSPSAFFGFELVNFTSESTPMAVPMENVYENP